MRDHDTRVGLVEIAFSTYWAVCEQRHDQIEESLLGLYRLAARLQHLMVLVILLFAEVLLGRTELLTIMKVLGLL